jgi:hypothetical protein
MKAQPVTAEQQKQSTASTAVDRVMGPFSLMDHSKWKQERSSQSPRKVGGVSTTLRGIMSDFLRKSISRGFQ